MKFLTILIKCIFHEHHSHPKIKIRKKHLLGSGKCTNRFGTFKSFMTATRSPEGQSINTKLSYMKFLTICIEYIFHEQPRNPKIKI
ncbi:hypothetical protein TYRP_003250 [Tyrophagus putrescentiae]|nr:hypothetical protein TYRP_003250 [Tyrophagus putrescentiae]